MASSLIVYAATARGDASLRDAVRAGGALTVVALAPVEPSNRPCCDIRSVYWNGVQRDLARSKLARARLATEGADDVTLEVLEVDSVRPVEAIVRPGRRGSGRPDRGGRPARARAARRAAPATPHGGAGSGVGR